jgi:hypothetical protein
MENKQNLYDWIVKIIDSCRDDFHFEGVDRIIELFNDKFKDENVLFELKMKRTDKWNEIHTIIAPHLNR